MRAVRQTNYKWVYLFAAVCLQTGNTHEWMMPHVNTAAMNIFMETFGRSLDPDVHAVMLLDQAGWHTTDKLRLPENVSFIHLPPKSPELNPTENIWQYLRQTWLSNRVFESYEDICEACCQAWNNLAAEVGRIASIGRRAWAKIGQSQ